MMMERKIKILGISGSLRPGSSATAVLNVVSGLVPDYVGFSIYDELETIPPFNDSNDVPLPVQRLIEYIANADGAFFCIPEYAFGVPGALKNALDWTVAATAFTDKPVALITTASQGEKAHAALLNTLTALGTKITADTNLLISFIRSKLNEQNEIKDIATMDAVRKVVVSLIQLIEANDR